uniref:Tyrosine-protein kinase shark n=1 Tax=Triatoma infestans TaxID=30076 RepID=A0A161MGE6_TRIIF
MYWVKEHLVLYIELLYQTTDGVEMEVAVKTLHKEHINSNERDFYTRSETYEWELENIHCN